MYMAPSGFRNDPYCSDNRMVNTKVSGDLRALIYMGTDVNEHIGEMGECHCADLMIYVSGDVDSEWRRLFDRYHSERIMGEAEMRRAHRSKLTQ